MAGLDFLETEDFEVHPDAAAELEEALDAFLEKSSRLKAQQFQNAINDATNLILEMPTSWQIYPEIVADPAIHKKNVSSFKYQIFYQPRETIVWILAYASEKRRPGYWADRLTTHIPKTKSKLDFSNH